MTSRHRTTVLDTQPALFDDTPPKTLPTPSKPAQPAPKKKRTRNHQLALTRPWTAPMPCAALCLVCRRPEEIGACPEGCSIVCGPPDRRGPVEVCVLTLTLPARLIAGRAAVACPHCDATHWHAPTPGRAYRIGPCGQPYIVDTPP
ncbi:hypothetical protein ABZW11_17075 [Nonomuraea sp. NPDC004580]|uniref:hypothetical protein n=1 Tax=Nonomuraea sp. NPDC004580 TaxID=3154552 RepID=UPI0033BC0783